MNNSKLVASGIINIRKESDRKITCSGELLEMKQLSVLMKPEG